MGSDQYSAARICLFLSASSRVERVSRQVSCGLYPPGSIGMMSLTGRPNTLEAADNLMSGSGVLEDCALKGVCVQITLVARIVCNQTLDGFHSDLCPAIAVREGN